MKGVGVIDSARLRIKYGEQHAQRAHVVIIGAKRVVGVADDALAQDYDGRVVLCALTVGEGEPGENAQGAGIAGAQEALVVCGDLLLKPHFVVEAAHLAVAVRVMLARLHGVGMHRAEASRSGVREPAP